MGRRALSKFDPSIDLSFHLRTVESLPTPCDINDLFGRQAPLEVEMGSGKGLFLQNAATQNPETNFLGVEVSFKYARHTAARLAKRDIRNAISVHGDGLCLFRQIIADSSLAAVHVYFPDPWWKKRHHKRRVLNQQFLDDVVRTLLPQGRLHFWTDVKDYYDATLQLITSYRELEGPLPVSERPPEHDLDYRTHFERRTRLNNEPVYRAEFTRK